MATQITSYTKKKIISDTLPEIMSAIQGLGNQGKVNISTLNNGKYFASVESENSQSLPVLQVKTITSNGTYYPDNGYDGFSSIIVNIQSQDTPSEKEVDLLDSQYFEKEIYLLGQYNGEIYLYCKDKNIYKINNENHISIVYTNQSSSNYIGFNPDDGSFIIQKNNSVGESLTYWCSNDFSEEIQIPGSWNLNNYSNFLPYFTYPRSYTYYVVNRGQTTLLETSQYIESVFSKDNYFFMFDELKDGFRKLYIFRNDGTMEIPGILIKSSDTYNVGHYCQPLYNGKFLTIKPTTLNSGTMDASIESRVYIFDSNGLDEEYISSFEGTPTSNISFYYNDGNKSYVFFRTSNGFIKIDVDTGVSTEITNGFVASLPNKEIIQLIKDNTKVGYYYFITKEYYKQEYGSAQYKYSLYFIDLISNTAGPITFN